MTVIFKKGDHFLRVFKKLLEEKGIKGGFFYGLGGFTKVILAFYDLKKKKYVTRKFKNGPFEVLSLTGNAAVDEKDEMVIHAHAVLGKRDFRTVGGHLIEGIVGGTLEIFINETERLKRRHDEATGLRLIQ